MSESFHLEEYRALTAESMEFAKITWANLQYAVIASGAIMGWLMTETALKDKPQILDLGKYLPLALSLVFGVLSIAAYLRVKEADSYLKKIENDVLGPVANRITAPKLGWHTAGRWCALRMEMFHLIAWLILLAVDIRFIYVIPG